MEEEPRCTRNLNATPAEAPRPTRNLLKMSAGVWKLNGEPIIISQAGELLTGRLRLHACIQADRPFPSLVVHNIQDKHFETIDAVRRRTLGDVLTIRREADGRALAAALNVLWRYANGDLVSARRRVSSSQLLQNSARKSRCSDKPAIDQGCSQDCPSRGCLCTPLPIFSSECW